MPRPLMAILIALLLAPTFSGCKQEDSKKQTDEGSEPVAAASEKDSAPEADVATQGNTLPDSDATAREVCESFLRLLAMDERSLAEQLLTRKALKVTVAAGLELEALGGPESTIKVDDAMYATSRARVAQVGCTVTEKDKSKQEIVWLMRRGESGWRIAGLIVDTGKSQEFLSLENRADVNAIIASKGGAPKSDDVRLVSGTDDE